MQEITQVELDGLVRFNRTKIGIYFYTPLCGTCKVATKMLEVVEEAEPDFPLYRCNMNLVSSYAEKWQLTSVPCLVLVDQKQVVSRVYAFQSVSHLFSLIKAFKSQG